MPGRSTTFGNVGVVAVARSGPRRFANLLPPEGGPYFAKEYTQIAMSSGAIVGTVVAALMAGWIGRRIVYAMLCVGSFASLVYLYQGNDAFGAKLLASVFAAGGITAALLRLVPALPAGVIPDQHPRNAQGFAYNFGRVISAIGTLQTATLTAFFAQGIAADRRDIEAFPKAGATLAAIYLIGLFIIWLGPETKGKPLPT